MNGVALSMEDVRREANNFLEKYNPSGELPIPIEEIAELKLGIFVLATPGIKKLIGIDGFIEEWSRKILLKKIRTEPTFSEARRALRAPPNNPNYPKL